MSVVYSLSTTVEITFILPKPYHKKSTRKQINVKLYILLYVKNWVNFHSFFHLSFPKVLYKRIVYKKTDEWYIDWQRVTANDNKCQRVTTSGKTSDKERQRMEMNNSEWEMWYSEWRRHSKLERMDDSIISIAKRDTLLLQGMDGCN